MTTTGEEFDYQQGGLRPKYATASLHVTVFLYCLAAQTRAPER